MAKYDLTPRAVDKVNTKYRKIKTKIPVPESLKIFKMLEKSEPRSMSGQPPVVWDHAKGFLVSDAWGNTWIDWSSGVLITNVGHGHPRLCKAIQSALKKPLLATYCFVHEQRAQLTKMLSALAPKKAEYCAFLLSTGAEGTENAIKLARTYGVNKGGERKHVIVSYDNAFHGRTLGAQLAGGNERLKKWIIKTDCGFVQVPFPDGYKNENTSFDLFLDTLKRRKLTGADVAGVIVESYQGVGPDFLPDDYAKKLEKWCNDNDVILICDEVQSGFGRTGKMFCFEHYGIQPDLICCGKGISSSLPISAVIGRADIMNLYPPGSMTSTHSGSPLCVAAAIESLKILKDEKLVENAAKLDKPLRNGLLAIQKKHPKQAGCVQSRGLVAGIQIVKPGTKEPDPDTAQKINESCMDRGLLMFAPVGIGGECVKIAPPLCINREALEEGLAVLDEVCDIVLCH
ncbi:MAG: aminotransferase class III-fold pyridoxal phosphate-dependent enzyme [Planctomycetota bacterium]